MRLEGEQNLALCLSSHALAPVALSAVGPGDRRKSERQRGANDAVHCEGSHDLRCRSRGLQNPVPGGQEVNLPNSRLRKS